MGHRDSEARRGCHRPQGGKKNKSAPGVRLEGTACHAAGPEKHNYLIE
jgi:hypothetical protein